MTQNQITNRVTITISDADLQAIQGAVKTLQGTLVPYLVDLGPADRQSLCKQGAKTVDFVNRTLAYAVGNPQLVNSMIDVNAFQLDSAAMTTLRSLQLAIDPIAHLLDSSTMQTGSQAFAAALECYGSFKLATKKNLPQAVSISTDLAQRFAGMGKKATAKVPVAPVTPVLPVTPAIKGSMAPLPVRAVPETSAA